MKKLIDNIKAKTPKLNVIIWLISTIMYICTIIINEHFDLLQNVFQFEIKMQNYIRLIGMVVYISITTFNFSKIDTNASSQ
jgi:hypothetical protein